MTRSAIPPFTTPPAALASLYTGSWTDVENLGQISLGNGFTLRYLQEGAGPPLVLMHTARSQLDYFQRLIPLLRDCYTVYAVDLPGHGWSTIRCDAVYSEPLFRAAIKAFVQALDLVGVTLVGDSIGAVLSLTVAAELPERVRRAVPVNLFDYPGGVQRANAIARAVVGAYQLPGIGYLFSNMENRSILRAILGGGFVDRTRLPGQLLHEFRRVGRRPGYPQMARSLFLAMPSFIAARSQYPGARLPVTMVYGAADWSSPPERAGNHRLVPGAEMITLEDTSHFASLERPEAVARIILNDSFR